MLKHVEVAREKQADAYYKGRKPAEFTLREMVWRKIHTLLYGAEGICQKLAGRYEGLLKILEKKSLVYILETSDKRQNPMTRVNELKRYVLPQNQPANT